MMTMFFSEELKILDDNTVKYMIDQLEEEVKEQKAKLSEKDATIANKDSEIAQLRAELEKYKSMNK
jgi:multidrug resistance efflux pump